MDDLMRDVMVHGAEGYMQYLAKRYIVPIVGLRKVLDEWRETLE
jgi:hypothetical protein